MHCTIYACAFITFLPFIMVGWAAAVSAVVLWLSHFWLDTYGPVAWWARRFRHVQMPLEEWVKTPAGFTIFVTVDQIFHAAFLWVPVGLVLWCPRP
jgi:hypothetical protein